MLTCVCRPVSSSFVDKQSIMGAPIDRNQIVVTSEPKTKIGTAKPIVNQNPQVSSSCSVVECQIFFRFPLFWAFVSSVFKSSFTFKSFHTELRQSVTSQRAHIKCESISSVISNFAHSPRSLARHIVNRERFNARMARSSLSEICLLGSVWSLANNREAPSKAFMTRKLSPCAVHVNGGLEFLVLRAPSFV